MIIGKDRILNADQLTIILIFCICTTDTTEKLLNTTENSVQNWGSFTPKVVRYSLPKVVRYSLPKSTNHPIIIKIFFTQSHSCHDNYDVM